MSTPPPPDSVATAPPPATPSRLRTNNGPPLTPEQVRRIEINRLKAKAIRERKEQEDAAIRLKAGLPPPDVLNRGVKRLFDNINSPSTTANGITSTNGNSHGKNGGPSSNLRNAKTAVTPATMKKNNAAASDSIQPARKFTQFVEYDLSKMSDTKGGFLSTHDDPNSVLGSATVEGKPANMTLEEWEKFQLKIKLAKGKEGAFEPAITVGDVAKNKKCRECGSLEIDWKWLEVFGIGVCGRCKEEKAEKYSLLTKTECREDYLLTDPELRDEEILPHMERPNPHKSNWATMQLYLRFQVEEFAFKKWGSPEALDEEFEKRTAEQKRRKEEKFKKRLSELKRRTRVETWKKQGRFDGEKKGKHQHEWGEVLSSAEGGMGVKTCLTCGMEVEELLI